MMTISELDRRFGIKAVATVVEGNGGLTKVVVSTPVAEGEMYLHGAHVTAWKPRGAEEVLFLSGQSKWQDGKAIRGGVPICFPWFGDHPENPKAPAHGFARTRAWELESIERVGDGVAVSMSLTSDERTKEWWPADFRLVHRAVFGMQLSLELSFTNTGSRPVRFAEALHTYYRVGEVEQIRVAGLDGVEYLDKTDGNRRKRQDGEIVINSETDRIYLDTDGAIDVRDAVLRRRIRVEKLNSKTTVIWNPWIEKARSMSDLGDEEWKQMVCVECCNAADYQVTVEPGGQHVMKAITSVGS